MCVCDYQLTLRGSESLNLIGSLCRCPHEAWPKLHLQNHVKVTSLVVLWLRPSLQWVRVQSMVKELRPHIPCGKNPEHKQQKQYCSKINKDFKSGPYKKKKKKKNLKKRETCQRAGQQIFGFEILVYDFDFYLMLAGSFSTPGFYLVWMNTLEAKHVEF